MEVDKQKYVIAYFREFDYSNQCELHFCINTEVPILGMIEEEIKAVRQKTDNVSSLRLHIKNKLQKIFQEKLDLNDDEIDIIITLKQEFKNIEDTMILTDLIDSLKKKEIIIFQVFDQKFTILLNAPLVKQMELPIILYANFSVQPTKFRAMFTDKNESLFFWYKSTDKTIWESVGNEFKYFIKEDDVNHYLKLICVPLNEDQVKGPTTEVISQNKVEIMGSLPTCPFEKRHEFTKKKLAGLEFRVVSYNILADKYACLGDGYAYCAPNALAIDYRKQLIFKELSGYKADIICLQEVDNIHYSSYFKEKFKELGYSSIYHRKGNRIPEGLAIIFNKKRFKQVDSKHIVLSAELERTNRPKVFTHIWDIIKKNEVVKEAFLKQSTSLQVMVFQVKDNNKHLIVGNTHLFYHPDADHIRLLQATAATTYLNMLKNRYMRYGDVSVIFCGDFNSCPEKSLFAFMTQGRINPQHKDCLTIGDKPILFHEFIFESSCGTPTYTNYTPDYKGCLDYIFIETNKIKVQQVVPLTEEDELNKYEGIPNEFFPSDHLALVVDLKFKNP